MTQATHIGIKSHAPSRLPPGKACLPPPHVARDPSSPTAKPTPVQLRRPAAASTLIPDTSPAPSTAPASLAANAATVTLAADALSSAALTPVSLGNQGATSVPPQAYYLVPASAYPPFAAPAPLPMAVPSLMPRFPSPGSNLPNVLPTTAECSHSPELSTRPAMLQQQGSPPASAATQVQAAQPVLRSSNSVRDGQMPLGASRHDAGVLAETAVHPMCPSHPDVATAAASETAQEAGVSSMPSQIDTATTAVSNRSTPGSDDLDLGNAQLRVPAVTMPQCSAVKQTAGLHSEIHAGSDPEPTSISIPELHNPSPVNSPAENVTLLRSGYADAGSVKVTHAVPKSGASTDVDVDVDVRSITAGSTDGAEAHSPQAAVAPADNRVQPGQGGPVARGVVANPELLPSAVGPVIASGQTGQAESRNAVNPWMERLLATLSLGEDEVSDDHASSISSSITVTFSRLHVTSEANKAKSSHCGIARMQPSAQVYRSSMLVTFDIKCAFLAMIG